MKNLFIGILVIIFIGVLAAATQYFKKPVDGVACTLEAKQCPDGSYVGRTGPSCEYAPCPAGGETLPDPIVTPTVPPTEEEQVFCTADVQMCPDGSYVGRVAPSCAFAPCP